jgi:hypothetical protein
MSRPSNWADVVKAHGWGTAPVRLMRRTRRDDETGCIEWTGPLKNALGQIRISVAGHVWTENVNRLAWMIVHQCPVFDGYEIKRTCCNRRCVRHLRLCRAGAIASVCEYRKRRDAAHDAAQARANSRQKLTPRQVATIRRYRAQGRPVAPLAARFGVSAGTIYNAASGATYADSWLDHDRALAERAARVEERSRKAE